MRATALLFVITAITGSRAKESKVQAIIRPQSQHSRYCANLHGDISSFKSKDDFVANAFDLLLIDSCQPPYPRLRASTAIVATAECDESTANDFLTGLLLRNEELVIISSDESGPQWNVSNDMYPGLTLLTLAEADYRALTKTRHNYLLPPVTVYVLQPKSFDLSELAMAVMAIFIVSIGPIWSYYQNRNNKAQDEEKSQGTCVSVLCTLLTLGMVIGILLLLYYFYKYAIYAVLALFALGSWFGLSDIVASAADLLPQRFQCRCPVKKVPFAKTPPTILSVASYLISLGLPLFWFFARHQWYSWILQDILGIALILHIYKGVVLKSLKACTTLMILFLIYDVFFVFITPLFTKSKESIMIKVATGGRAGSGAKETLPLLLRLPSADPDYSACHNEGMLGFGDMIIPGLLISYCLLIDRQRHSAFVFRGYFFPVILAYGAGLGITYCALALMKSGQPALLYLVPSTLGMVFFLAWRNGDTKALWSGKVLTPALPEFVELTQQDKEKEEEEEKEEESEEELVTDDVKLIKTSKV
ncbi:signal peptide peptidase-like 2B [Oscarella lobularis]|uniref:signal peptide peptidase-like 2B n=1 Tax=Oscarella lobularis TaxID=121494 RepID=UPI0033131C77